MRRLSAVSALFANLAVNAIEVHGLLLLSALVSATCCGDDFSRWVDPFVGTAGVGHTFPGACVPFGLVQSGPDTGNGSWDYCSGYQQRDKAIVGFSQSHINGTGCRELGDWLILPFKGETSGSEPIDKKSECAEPGSYAVTLSRMGIRTEITVTSHCALYRMTPSRPGGLRVLLDGQWGIVHPDKAASYVQESEMLPCGTNAIAGWRSTEFWGKRKVSFAMRFSHPFVRAERLAVRNPKEKGVRYFLEFDVPEKCPLLVKIGISAEGDSESAKRNLDAEIPAWDFDAARCAARAKWNEVLSKATIEGTDEHKKNWYTSLYHLFIQPNNIADVGRKPFYSTLSTWDTFRAAHPLYTILAPGKAAEFVDSMLEQGRRTGYLPIWTLWGKDNQCMIGTHSVPVIVDWFLKECENGNDTNLNCHNCSQITNTNSNSQLTTPNSQLSTRSTCSTRLKNDRMQYWLAAYAQMKDTLTKAHKGRIKERWDLLDKYGYYPFDVIKGESVSRTMECAYDDWCAGVMARRLSELFTNRNCHNCSQITNANAESLKADAEFFFRRSENWRNVFDASVGMVRGKDSQGRWREPFNPFALGHGAGTANDFTEGNAFQYTWHVMQNPLGLVDAMGGRDAFVKRLDSLFSQPETVEGAGCVLDVTGLIGQYVHGNEPSHHVIYFYPQVGRPEKAAERIREVFDKFYLPKPDGLCGNDDCGQMSAWYIFSAMGFYPFNPCGGEYVIGAPQVEKVTIKLDKIDGQSRTRNANCFTMIAKNLSRENKYVKRVSLNGKPLSGFILRHSDIVAGGELVFEMTADVEHAR